MFQILVAEDNLNSAKLMKIILNQAGYKVVTATNGIEALEIMDSKHIDLIVLDVMMPKMDGYEFTRQLRQSGNNTPILMVTAKYQNEDKCEGFLAGTDDYMVKPVNEMELLLRIKALLRRSQIISEHKLRIGDITLDYDSLSVSKNGQLQVLPQKEFYLLYTLLSSPEKVFTRLQLMDSIWGMNSESVDTTVNVHINRLRKRFEGWTEFEIIAIRGVGYMAVINDEKKA
ncbi:MAG: response regulator transcription factor [Ruminococcaceae bacterium]|nr:response regulator transcription factor [Oscillospiraceae bacterium]MBR3596914.1 response regulator transcription factor [Clostridia bacterium]